MCRGLNLHVLLGLDGLVQSVAPATAFHYTAGLLVNNLYLAINDYIFIVLVEHGVSLEQLLQGMHTLALHGEMLQQAVLFVESFLVAQSLLVL